MDISTLKRALLPLSKRDRTAHKGHFGHALIVGGDLGMGGAALLAGLFSARTGAGKVTIATRPEHITAILAKEPCLMAKGVQSPGDLLPLLQEATTLILGPGLGRSSWSKELFEISMSFNHPKVMDADALFWLKKNYIQLNENSIMTPHPKEASMLLDLTVEDVQTDRVRAVQRLHERFGGVVILKGANTLICDGNKIDQCDYGNPGMASGGMGDALSGILGGLLAQNVPAGLAAQIGVLAHALAGDKAAKDIGEIGLLATDLLNTLPKILN